MISYGTPKMSKDCGTEDVPLNIRIMPLGSRDTDAQHCLAGVNLAGVTLLFESHQLSTTMSNNGSILNKLSWAFL